MKSDGRLQTAEHVLARTIQNKFGNMKIVIAKFSEDEGCLDVSCKEDLRAINLTEVENEVNEVISRGLEVKKIIYQREEIHDFDLSRIPEDAKEIRIVEIGDFDKRPCKDPHVDNTREIGKFVLKSVKREGKDRYRFIFDLE